MKESNHSHFYRIGRPLLPIIVKPLPNELLSSWIIRYAKALKTKSHTFCKFIFPEQNVWNADIDLYPSDDFLKELVMKTGLTETQVYNTTLKSYHPNLFVEWSTSLFLPIRIFHRTRKGNGLMACPSCFKKDAIPYFRKEWRVAFMVSCPECQTMLIDHCPKCKSPIAFHRLEVGSKELPLEKDICLCYKCGFDLRECKPVPCVLNLLRLQNRFKILMERGYDKHFQYSHLYFEVVKQIAWLLDSTTPKLAAFNELVSSQSGINSLQIKKTEFQKKDLVQRALILTKIAWMFEKWPHRLIDVSKKTKTYKSYLLRDMENVPYWFWKLVIENLYVVYSSKQKK